MISWDNWDPDLNFLFLVGPSFLLLVPVNVFFGMLRWSKLHKDNQSHHSWDDPRQQEHRGEEANVPEEKKMKWRRKEGQEPPKCFFVSWRISFRVLLFLSFGLEIMTTASRSSPLPSSKDLNEKPCFFCFFCFFFSLSTNGSLKLSQQLRVAQEDVLVILHQRRRWWWWMRLQGQEKNQRRKTREGLQGWQRAWRCCRRTREGAPCHRQPRQQGQSCHPAHRHEPEKGREQRNEKLSPRKSFLCSLPCRGCRHQWRWRCPHEASPGASRGSELHQRSSTQPGKEREKRSWKKKTGRENGKGRIPGGPWCGEQGLRWRGGSDV